MTVEERIKNARKMISGVAQKFDLRNVPELGLTFECKYVLNEVCIQCPGLKPVFDYNEDSEEIVACFKESDENNFLDFRILAEKDELESVVLAFLVYCIQLKKMKDQLGF